jgi:putative (di)nucleoside polyphosphate hydrolase
MGGHSVAQGMAKRYRIEHMIDKNGYRANVGIILSNCDGKVFWGKRVGQDAWQFPQGGIKRNESHRAAMYRELREEVGLKPSDVEIIGSTQNWLRYHIPKQFIRWHSKPLCIGQKQHWYVLRMKCDEDRVCLDHSFKPEFEDWCWVDYWHPPRHVVHFKRQVYCRALAELAPLLFPNRMEIPDWVNKYVQTS